MYFKILYFSTQNFIFPRFFFFYYAAYYATFSLFLFLSGKVCCKGSRQQRFPRCSVYKKVNQIEILHACTCYRNTYKGDKCISRKQDVIPENENKKKNKKKKKGKSKRGESICRDVGHVLYHSFLDILIVMEISAV